MVDEKNKSRKNVVLDKEKKLISKDKKDDKEIIDWIFDRG